MSKIITKITPEPALRNENHTVAPTSPTHNYLHAATSDNTRKAYQADIRHFENWGGANYPHPPRH